MVTWFLDYENQPFLSTLHMLTLQEEGLFLHTIEKTTTGINKKKAM